MPFSLSLREMTVPIGSSELLLKWVEAELVASIIKQEVITSCKKM